VNYASVEMFPNNFVITVFDENATLLDSFYFGNHESCESVNRRIKEIEEQFHIEKWVSSQERKMIERQNL